jgi:hypothetical protein
MELVLMVSSVGVVDDEALGLRLLVVGGRLEDVKVFLKLDFLPLFGDAFVEVGVIVVVEGWL